MTIPPALYNNSGLAITLQRFFTKVGATYKGRAYIVSKGCTGGKYRFGGDFTFVQVDRATKAQSTNMVSVKSTTNC